MAVQLILRGPKFRLEAIRRVFFAPGNDAIRARLRPARKALDDAYKAAARERWRKAEARDWETIDIEDWPA